MPYTIAPLDPSTWDAFAELVDPKHRGQGVARAALEGALDQIAHLGGGTVEAISEVTADVPAEISRSASSGENAPTVPVGHISQASQRPAYAGQALLDDIITDPYSDFRVLSEFSPSRATHTV
jgi:hypothetical protein